MWRGQTGLSQDATFPCYTCGKKFDGVVNLMIHKRQSHEPGPAEHAALAQQEAVRKQRQTSLREKHEAMQREHEAKLEEKRRRRKTSENPEATDGESTTSSGNAGPSPVIKKKQRKARKQPKPEPTQKPNEEPPRKLRRLRRPS